VRAQRNSTSRLAPLGIAIVVPSWHEPNDSACARAERFERAPRKQRARGQAGRRLRGLVTPRSPRGDERV
jgi:hypothetical protein